MAVLVFLSLLSLASGTSGGAVSRGVNTVVEVAAYPFWKAFHGVGEGCAYIIGLVTAYGQAQEEVERLQLSLNENLIERAAMRELKAENDRLRKMAGFQQATPGIALKPTDIIRLPAEVISRSGGMLTVDQGALHGVKEFMCAMTKDGVVGVVTRVEPTSSKVAPLYSADCKIGAMIRRNRVTGMVHGSGSLMTHICSMRYIDLKDEVLEGDQVVTSGGSVLYPAGIPIGTIEGTPREEGALQRAADIMPAVDLFSLDEVFLVMRRQHQHEELAGPPLPRDIVSTAPAMPDNRPAQERYAP